MMGMGMDLKREHKYWEDVLVSRLTAAKEKSKKTFESSSGLPGPRSNREVRISTMLCKRSMLPKLAIIG